MFTGFMAILQALWPFLRESVLGNDTFKTWILNNKMTVAWFLLIAIMFVLVLYLSEQLTNWRQQATEYSHKVDVLQVEYNGIKSTYALLSKDYDRASRDLVISQEKETILQGKVDRYEHWMRLCGMNYNYQGNGPNWPRCREPVHPKPKPHPKNTDRKKNRSFIERLLHWKGG